MSREITLQTMWDDFCYEQLLTWIDNRIGHAMFIGAALPELAHLLTSRGISVMVVEQDLDRLNQFHEQTRAMGVEKRLSFDSRPYSDIRFEGSSYNLILAWNGLPGDTDLTVHFKKLRRELKAGGNVFIRTPIRREDPLGLRPRLDRIPEKLLKPWAEKAYNKLISLMFDPEAPSMDELQTRGGSLLKIDEVVYSGQLLSRVARIMPSLLDRKIPWTGLIGLIRELEKRTTNPKLSPSVLIKASKTLDLGNVFLTGSRFDPRFASIN